MTIEELNKLKRDIEELSCSTSVKSGQPLLRRICSEITHLKPTIDDAYASNLLSEIGAGIDSIVGNQRNGKNILALTNQKLYQLKSFTTEKPNLLN